MSSHGGDEHPWECLRKDVERYGGWGALLREQSLWAVLWYRIGCRWNMIRFGVIRRPLMAFWWLGFRFVELLIGVSLPVGATVGAGIRIWHFGGIFVNSHAVIGSNCTLRHGVTIGSRYKADDAPVIGRDVQIGSYAQIIGRVQIGNRVKIGSMTVVLKDIPDDCSAVGNPMRIVPHEQ